MIGTQLLNSGIILVELVDEEKDKELKIFIQRMLDQGELQIERRVKGRNEEEISVVDILYDAVNVEIPINPLVIEFLAPFVYEDEKAVPWIYQPKYFKQGQEGRPLVINEPNVTSVVGPAGMTRNGRVCARYPDFLKYVENTILDQVKEKIICA